MNVVFSNDFVKSLKKYISIKDIIKSKVDMIIKSPIGLGELLKWNFRGYYSCPVKKNFLIIFLYCRVCRKKGDDKIVMCSNCKDYSDETLKFIDLGPHDKVYAD